MSTLTQILGLDEANDTVDSSYLFANRSNVRCKRGSNEQKSYLLNYLESDPDFAQDRYEGVEGRRLQNEKWKQLASELNNIEGAKKNGQEWRKYWRDLVLRTKSRAQEFHVNAKKDPIYRKSLKPLSAEELQIIKILTYDDMKSNINMDLKPICHLSSNNEMRNDPPINEHKPPPKMSTNCSLDSLQGSKSEGEINAVDYVLGDTTAQITTIEDFQEMINQKFTASQNPPNTPNVQQQQQPQQQQQHQQQHQQHQQHQQQQQQRQQHQQPPPPPPPPPAATSTPNNNAPGNNSTNSTALKRKRKRGCSSRLVRWTQEKFKEMESIETKKVKLMEERNDLLKQIATSLKDISIKLNTKN